MPIKPMRAGALRRHLRIQQKIGQISDGAGGKTTPGWTDALSVWAQVTDLSGHEIFAAMQVSAHTMKRITMRYPPSLQVTAAMRLVDIDGNLSYNIRNVSDVNERHRQLVLMCEEIPGY